MTVHRISNDHARGIGLAASGLLVVSFDALLVRLAHTDAATIVFWRGLFIATALTTVLQVQRGIWPWQAMRRAGTPVLWLLPGMGLTQMLFVAAVMHTAVANVVVILTTMPLIAAVLSGLLVREWVPGRTWAAAAVCIAAVALVFGGRLGGGHWLGDTIALICALVAAMNFTVLRRSPGVDRVALLSGAGLFSCLLVLPIAEPATTSVHSLTALAVMGLVEMPLALVLVSEATRYLPSPEVSLFIVVEAILAPLWVWAILGEDPPRLTLVGGALVLAALLAHSWGALRQEHAP